MMKDRFKPAEWEKVQRLPILMFHFVSLADRQLQKEEVETFVAELHDAMAYKDPLHRELFFDLTNHATFQKTFDYVMGPVTDSLAAVNMEFKAIKKALKKRSLTGTGLRIADAAGEGSARVSPEEMAALAVINGKFGVDIDAGRAALGRL